MAERGAGEITLLLERWSGGDGRAADELLRVTYRELRALAASYMCRERRDHTLQPTALVHEAYLRLADQTLAPGRSRTEFFIVAANLMRQILVNHARHRMAAKRDGGQKVALQEAAGVVQKTVDLVALDDALESLAQVDRRHSQIVELRFFGGLSEAEIAEALGVSKRTVAREWRLARAFLNHEIGTKSMTESRSV